MFCAVIYFIPPAKKIKKHDFCNFGTRRFQKYGIYWLKTPKLTKNLVQDAEAENEKKP